MISEGWMVISEGVSMMPEWWGGDVSTVGGRQQGSKGVMCMCVCVGGGVGGGMGGENDHQMRWRGCGHSRRQHA
jgi:hypothetical protein